MANFVAMLLLVLPILRRKSSKSRRKVKSISFIRILRERYCDNRERKDLCFDAEAYLPKLSRRVMVESKHSPIVQFTLRLLVSRRLSRVTSISNASSFLIRRFSSEIFLSICSWSSWLSGVLGFTRCFSIFQLSVGMVIPVPTKRDLRLCVTRMWMGQFCLFEPCLCGGLA